MSSRISEAAHLLATARRSHTRLPDFPQNLEPSTLQEAYAIQDAGALSHGHYGWKVGPARDGHAPRCAPLLGRGAEASPHILPKSSRSTEVELEIAVVLGKDLPPMERDYEAADVEAAVGSLHLAFELVGSRFEDRTKVSPLAAIADNQSNEAVVLGDALENWRNVDLAGLHPRLIIDGSECAPARPGASLHEVMTQLAWLANHTARRTNGLRAGDVVVTGARNGPLSIVGARTVEGNADPFAPVRLTAAADPTNATT